MVVIVAFLKAPYYFPCHNLLKTKAPPKLYSDKRPHYTIPYLRHLILIIRPPLHYTIPQSLILIIKAPILRCKSSVTGSAGSEFQSLRVGNEAVDPLAASTD